MTRSLPFSGRIPTWSARGLNWKWAVPLLNRADDDEEDETEDRRSAEALTNKTPMAVWRDGTANALGDKAVDTTLRLDNAIALPTCPQLQQQQELVA